jgi:rubrerythrin
MKTHELINGCNEIEKAVASIYSKFMQLFPDEKDFWEDLFKDEIGHSFFLIDALNYGIFNGQDTVDFPLSMSHVTKTMKFAENINKHIEFNPVSLEDALKTALKLEETMVEIFANDLIAMLSTPDNESFLQNILMEERSHIDKIRDMMIKKGFSKLS